MKAMGMGAGLLALCCGAAVGQVQEKIDAAFALQKDGATLTQVRAALAKDAGDDAVDFAVGAVEFLLAGEQFLQGAHGKGFANTLFPAARMLGADAGILAWLYNERPEPATYADIVAGFSNFVTGLDKADRTLQGAGGEFKCVIHLSNIRIDANADGRTEETESIGHLLSMLPPRYVYNAEEERYEAVSMAPEELVIAFDRGDASWLRGYCHLLMAVGEIALAHDGQDLFDRTGHVLFPDAQIKYEFLRQKLFLNNQLGAAVPMSFDVTDLIALIGNFELPVKEPARMHTALEHLRTTVTLGKEMWTWYDKETDDDREWIPNPNQRAGFFEVQVDAEMREAWLMFLDECDDLFAGRKVLRFWRGDGTQGIDVVKVFDEPEEFNLLYWIQGSAAAPFLREGEFTSDGTWARLEDVFDERVFRFSFWFN